MVPASSMRRTKMRSWSGVNFVVILADSFPSNLVDNGETMKTHYLSALGRRSVDHHQHWTRPARANRRDNASNISWISSLALLRTYEGPNLQVTLHPTIVTCSRVQGFVAGSYCPQLEFMTIRTGMLFLKPHESAVGHSQFPARGYWIHLRLLSALQACCHNNSSFQI